MDEHTGLADPIEAEWWLYEQVGRQDALAVALVDIDDMRGINDAHGHLFGNVVIGRLAELLRDATGTSDLAARFGGGKFLHAGPGDFLLAWPGDEATDAAYEADELRVRFRELEFSLGDGKQPGRFTLSAGVAGLEAAHRSRRRDLAGLLMAAQEACWAAKRDGGDRVRIA